MTRVLAAAGALLILAGSVTARGGGAVGASAVHSAASVRMPTGAPAPPPGGYFRLRPPGSWSSLPSGAACAAMVHRSTWEPRPDNEKRNKIMPDPNAVRASFAARPRAREGAYDQRWDSWLLARVDGGFVGTTDEIFQWAACKWGLRDDVLRAIALRESTWYQYETYESGRCVLTYGCGDLFPKATSASKEYCAAIAAHGYDYQADFGDGNCPKTFSIMGVMDWQDPAWGPYPENQNGTFPFNRDSTAFAVDYVSGVLRGCFEGWEFWLKQTGTGTYRSGRIWGCVGAWYSGDWLSRAAKRYISRVRATMASTPWLEESWPDIKPPCDQYGCPGPDQL